jgi:hypothetical protein
MGTDGVGWSQIQGAIDAVLERARGEWDRPALDRSAVMLVATLDDVQVRIRATADVAWSHAKALLGDGWTIEFRDLADELIPWSSTDGPILDRGGPSDDGVDPPTIAEEDLPPLPETAIDRLRDTA